MQQGRGHGEAVLCFNLRKCRKVGWHGRAGRYGGIVLRLDLKISEKWIRHGRAVWHGGTVRTCCLWKLDFHCFGCFCVFLFFFCNVFECNVGHFKTLALIPIDVYVGGSEPNQTQINPNKN